MKCDFCSCESVIATDCCGNNCCVDCWKYQQDWTLEKQAEVDRLCEENSKWFREEIPKILEENGIPGNSTGYAVCTKHRKLLGEDEDGELYCPGCNLDSLAATDIK